MSRPIPQWKLDMLKDAELANELVIKKAEADKVSAEAAARAAEIKTKCTAWHVWKTANPWMMALVETRAAVGSKTETDWEVQSKTAMKQVPNNQTCPYCGK